MKRLAMLAPIALVAGLLLTSLACGQAAAPSYPTKQIELVVPYSAGGGTDIIARVIAPTLSEKWGKPVSVVNKTGGSGVPGVMYVLGAQPDGYTMLMHAVSTAVLEPVFTPGTPFKPSDMAHIALINTNPFVTIVKGDSKWTTLKQLVDDIKANPAQFKYGAMGPSSVGAVGCGQLLAVSGIDVSKVTRVDLGGGGAQVVAAVAGGQVDFGVQNLSEVISLVEGGKLRALSVTTPQRVKQLPSVPTSKEAGVEGHTAVGFVSIEGPKALPQNVTDTWAKTVGEVMKDAKVVETIEKSGGVPDFRGPKEYGEFLNVMTDSANQLARQLGIQK